MSDRKVDGAATVTLEKLREPFPAHHISQLPKPTKQQTEEVRADFKKGIRCGICGSWHHPQVIHLDYVGHAALTDRLLDTDIQWSWEPLAYRDGLPAFDASGGLWIKLTVCGVTRLGYGHAAAKPNIDPGAREKEVIGDALRNAAMRFGAALDLWHKGDLHIEAESEPEAPAAPVPAKPRPEPLKGKYKTRAAARVAYGEIVRELNACEDESTLDAYLESIQADIEQFEAELELAWKGDGADFIGMEQEIKNARERCTSAAGEHLVDLVRAG